MYFNIFVNKIKIYSIYEKHGIVTYSTRIKTVKWNNYFT